MSFPSQNDDRRFLELLSKWLQGDFTRADERALRTLVEADAFRREAWEGLQALPEADHQERLAALRRRLRPQVEDKAPPVLRPVSGGRRAWLAAAAVLVVLIGAVWFFGEPMRDVSAPVAQKKAVPEPQTVPPTQDLAAAEDSESDYVLAPEAPRSRASQSRPADATGGRAGQPAAAQPGNALEADDAGANDAVSAAPPPPTEEKSWEAPVMTQDKAVEQNAEAAKPVPSSPAAKRKAAPAKDVAAQRSAADTMALRPPLPTPDGGWEALQRNLARQARLNDAARNQNVSGSVRLQFYVDAQGRPVNIAVRRGLGFGLDEEAMRLLGATRWLNGPGGPLEVDVPFVR